MPLPSSPKSCGFPPVDRRRVLSGAAGLAAFGLALGGPSLAGPVVRGAFALAVPGPEDVGGAPADYPALFGTRELALGDPLDFLPKARVLVDALAVGSGGGGATARWDALIAELAGAAPMTRVGEVNRFVNAVRYVDDRRNWGMDDRWAAPAEFFARGGDCEDFALAKFVSLSRLGFSRDRLRMVLAQDRRKRVDHAFLVVYLGGEALVLDNQIEAVTAQAAISHYRPLCSFNDHRLWMHRG